MRHSCFVIVVLALVSLSRAMVSQSQAEPSAAPAAKMYVAQVGGYPFTLAIMVDPDGNGVFTTVRLGS